jgi:hypothetical protein
LSERGGRKRPPFLWETIFSRRAAARRQADAKIVCVAGRPDGERRPDGIKIGADHFRPRTT